MLELGQGTYVNEAFLKKLADDVGGQLEEIGILPDDSGFATITMSLPKDHWIYRTDEYGFTGDPPIPMRMGTDNPEREKMSQMLRAAGKYAVRAATSCGKYMDFDPDALLQTLVVGMLGYWTPDGLSHMNETTN